MQPKLLANKELDNYAEQDSFDFLTKAEAIKYFLEQNSIALEKNKMLVLYGDWGSGKTSLMTHIKDTIDTNIYKPIFFHAWEHEKDENLALSLCDAITETLENESVEVVKDFMKGALIALKGFTSGITLKSSGVLSGIGIDFELSGEKINNEIDKAISESTKPSFYKSNKEFKEKFLAVENAITKKFDCQKILVFIDDLDRCEPENVLNLITALKLLFTFGNKTVYFCGIDKEAVTKAVRTKYKDVIKSEEYMEKVFDVAFSMPKTFSLHAFIRTNFKNLSSDNISTIESFFTIINFTTPRHLKKVLNKYFILCSFNNLQMQHSIGKLIPDLLHQERPHGHILDTICSLYIIILYEYNIQIFNELEDYSGKLKKYADKLGGSYAQTYAQVEHYLAIEDVKRMRLQTLLKGIPDDNGFTKFILFFSHSNPTRMAIFYDNDIDEYNKNFTDNSISTLFCSFLIARKELFSKSDSEYILWDFFRMAKYLL